MATPTPPGDANGLNGSEPRHGKNPRDPRLSAFSYWRGHAPTTRAVDNGFVPVRLSQGRILEWWTLSSWTVETEVLGSA
jgi:hypothetical protein